MFLDYTIIFIEFKSASFVCILFVGTAILLSQAGLAIFNLLVSQPRLPPSNEVAGILFGVYGLIYSLILAFVIVAVWEDYEELNQTIEKEADKLNGILLQSLILPDSLRQPIKSALSAYCDQVIGHEWQMQNLDGRYQATAILELRLLLSHREPQSKTEESVISVVSQNLNSIFDLHRDRLSHTRSHIPELVWLTLIVGTIMMIVFSYFLSMPSQWLKRVYISFLVTGIAMSLFLVYSLDHPFSGTAQVSKFPYESILLDLR